MENDNAISKITGTVWLVSTLIYANLTITTGHWIFIIQVVLGIILIEFNFRIVWNILKIIHLKIYFYRVAKIRRHKYFMFKKNAKWFDNSDDFEDQARFVIR